MAITDCTDTGRLALLVVCLCGGLALGGCDRADSPETRESSAGVNSEFGQHLAKSIAEARKDDERVAASIEIPHVAISRGHGVSITVRAKNQSGSSITVRRPLDLDYIAIFDMAGNMVLLPPAHIPAQSFIVIDAGQAVEWKEWLYNIDLPNGDYKARGSIGTSIGGIYVEAPLRVVDGEDDEHAGTTR